MDSAQKVTGGSTSQKSIFFLKGKGNYCGPPQNGLRRGTTWSLFIIKERPWAWWGKVQWKDHGGALPIAID